ncbi:Hypp7922 [Branchiostoma lanceolatum]|uniref:Hypp7922 protein n=1 Tax=Branchiostoma lanceolatum TaxID=7740 RepID=A0A8J9Z5B0_BRALA|nr:Hypp7922 [Branchiostoma lanceolatum]
MDRYTLPSYRYVVCEDDNDMPFEESCYHYETEEPTDKDSAEIICQQGGGSLVSISSSDEYGMIMDEYEEKTYYLGATWINDAWAWDSGSTDGLDLLTSLNAPDGSDTQRCLMMMNGDLTATDCDTAREFLCETPGEQGEEDEDDESARENGYDICETPMDIECRLVGTDYVLGNGGISDDGLTKCEEDEDDESARENGYDICETPMDIECRLVGTDYVLGNGGISDDGLTKCTLEYGAQCEYK